MTTGEATTLSGLLAITTSAVIMWRLREYVTWKRLWPILMTFIVVSTIAIFALTRIEDHILRQILGVALILISIYFALFSQKIKLPTTKKVQAGAGTLSGLMGGFFGMQGPPAVLYFIQSEPTIVSGTKATGRGALPRNKRLLIIGGKKYICK